jgi:GNAT superfamily N-acetyltransferase
MPSWTVLTAPVPESLEAPEAWALHGAGRVSYEHETRRWGYPDLMYPAWYLFGDLQPQPYSIRRLLVAVPEGAEHPTAEDVVGFSKVAVPLQDNTHLADIELGVHPDCVDAGADEALLAAAEAFAAEHRRTSLVTWSEQVGEPAPGPGVLEPPTGSGRVDGTAHAATLLSAHGYVLEQAERYSLLRLPLDDGLLEAHQARAAARAGSDYSLVSWTDRAPDEWVDQVAVLRTRMSTDAPTADLDFEEARWDAERVRTWERQVADSQHGYLLSAAVHTPTRTLAGFTVLRYPVEYPEAVFQEDTLVLREHRGRRLGMLVKTENLRLLREVRPGAARVHTWNAEENSYMLDINVALGFHPTGVAGMWQKRTGRASGSETAAAPGSETAAAPGSETAAAPDSETAAAPGSETA